jgi:hypothetical protein
MGRGRRGRGAQLPDRGRGPARSAGGSQRTHVHAGAPSRRSPRRSGVAGSESCTALRRAGSRLVRGRSGRGAARRRVRRRRGLHVHARDDARRRPRARLVRGHAVQRLPGVDDNRLPRTRERATDSRARHRRARGLGRRRPTPREAPSRAKRGVHARRRAGRRSERRSLSGTSSFCAPAGSRVTTTPPKSSPTPCSSRGSSTAASSSSGSATGRSSPSAPTPWATS